MTKPENERARRFNDEVVRARLVDLQSALPANKEVFRVDSRPRAVVLPGEIQLPVDSLKPLVFAIGPRAGEVDSAETSLWLRRLDAVKAAVKIGDVLPKLIASQMSQPDSRRSVPNASLFAVEGVVNESSHRVRVVANALVRLAFGHCFPDEI